MARRRQNENPSDSELVDMILHPEKYHFEETPIEKRLRESYPDVPADYRRKWMESDESDTAKNFRPRTCLDLAAALEGAAIACRQLAAHQEPMTPHYIKQYEYPLTRAVHLAEDLLNDLEWDYPLPSENRYTRLRNHKDLISYAPKLLRNTEQQIIFWLRTLPSKETKAGDLIYWEIHDFLFSECRTILHRFTDWHCDFIHVHTSDAGAGIYDADNYIYKPIIDDLALLLGTMDSYGHFSFSAYNWTSDRIPAGCYISVTERTQKVGFLADFEEQIFAQK